MFSGRGDGWRAVIINSQSEYDFIQEKEKELSDHHPFWIGGSTDVDEDSFLTLRQYINASTGKTKNSIGCSFKNSHFLQYNIPL